MSSTWKRRQFLTSSAAVAASFGLSRHALPEVLVGREQAALPAPTVITGGVKPLLETNTARPQRYTPDGPDFVIRNGSEFFNRPLYGSNSDFRVDAGDRPEFSLYLPGHGGNLKLGLLSGPHSKWLAEADVVVARYRPGRMIYQINDALLGAATLRLELMTAGAGSGLLLRVDAQQTPSKSSLFWAFAGASGRKGRRNGDIGCEVQPVSEFFQVRREECSGNRYSLDEAGSSARLVSAFCELQFTFPHATQLRVGDFAVWGSAVPRMQAETGSTQNPILLGATEMRDEPLFLAIDRVTAGAPLAAIDLQPSYDARSKQLEAIAGHVAIESPDPYLNPVGPALSIVADALWDSEQGCVMHGCVAWRVALAGWRGPYVLDATGSHDRAKTHFRHWIARQNTSPITTADPATGPADPNTHLARKEHLLHSNGDLSGNHYDMNLVFFDVLLRHLRWTGDLEFAKEIWPAYKRHLAWEQRLFRRTFMSASGQELPLYEAYAAIWASDNLQYSGGGTAHASAYNIFSFREAGKIARLLGEDPQPYESEAALIRQAMEELLWQPQSGAFAEAKDLMGEQTVYTNPALWTIYHAIDSEVPSPRQAWQMAAERLAVLKRIPVHGEGLPDGGFMLSCSDWLPYLWSLNLLVLAENMHFALALWQAGMADEAYRLFRGNLFDSMYQGLCPGDFHMTSQLDVHRQEAQRDFGDPTGITSRALVEGLFGVRPHLLEGRIDVRPGFPATWNHAALHHTDFDLAWRRNAAVETYTFSNRFSKRATLRLSLPARTTKLPHITSNGEDIACRFDKDVIGAPRVLVEVPASRRVTLELLWKGESPLAAPAHRSYGLGDVLALPPGVQLSQVDDPQGCLHRGRVTRLGTHIVFANVHQGECSFALPITFDGGPAELPWSAVPMASEAAHTEPVDLSSVLSQRISEIFTRGYMEPRSPLCTLSIPDNLLGGWANIESNPPQIDDTGLRRAGGLLQTPLNVGFLTPSDEAPNCIFLSFFKPDHESFTHSITGRASGIYLLMTGTTLPQCSRMQHAVFTIEYTDGSRSSLPLRNPETWWPVEQDYLIDDYLFVNAAPVPPRVDLSSGRTRLVQAASFKGEGRRVPGGAATILYLALDPAKSLAAMRLDVNLYGIVVALLAATLVRA